MMGVMDRLVLMFGKDRRHEGEPKPSTETEGDGLSKAERAYYNAFVDVYRREPHNGVRTRTIDLP